MVGIKGWFVGVFVAVAVLGASPVSAEAYTWGNVRFEGGGFVSAVIPSQTQPGLIYARTDVGGAYRWDSVGGTWIPLLDWLAPKDVGLMGTEALALDPQDSKRLYILAGTSYFSGGRTVVFRSHDYGATFDTVDVTSRFVAHGNGMGRQTGEKLAVDPQNSAILFCGTRTKGLFRSADTGRTWDLVAGTAALSGSSIVDQAGISFVLFDPTSGKTAGGATKTIYLGVTGKSTSLYVSKDGGATFDAVGGCPAASAMRASLAGGFLYGTFSIGPGPFNMNGGSVWKYATATGAWTKITPKDADGKDLASGAEGYGYGFGGVSIDPANSHRVIISTLSFYGGSNRWPSANKGNAGDKFFLSVDDGVTWTDLMAQGLDDGTQPTVDPNGNGWIEGSSIHWTGSIEFDPFNSKKVWLTSGNGVFRSDDVTLARPLWKFQSRGIEETVPMQVVSVPGGPLVTAIMDYDGATYENILAPTPVHPHPVGGSNSLGYASLVGGILRSGRVTDYSVSPAVKYDVMYHSKDSGRTWAMTDTSTLPGSGGTLAMSADGRVFLMRPSELHSGIGASSASFYRSTDGGKSWKAVTGLSAQKGDMVSDPVNPAKFYIVPDGYTGDFFASNDTGASFAKISSIADNGRGEYSASTGLLQVVPGHAGEIWVPLDAEQSWTAQGYSSYGLAYSSDAGLTWTRLHTMDACLAVGLGKAAPGASYPALYIWGMANGGPLGVYRSIDKGQNWTRVNDDAHQYGGLGNGQFVKGDFNVYGRVYMSTAGRGIVYGEPVGTSSFVQRASLKAASLRRVGRSLVGVEPIHLLDLQGRSIRTSHESAGGTRMELSGLPTGLFVAKSGSEAILVDGRD